MTRGIATVAQLRSRCDCTSTPGCWIWLGAASGRVPQPRIWTFDHTLGDKRGMSGPLAAWNIAFGSSPRLGYLVFRACLNNLCVNPTHLREARTRAEIGLHIRLTGKRVGTGLESRRANMRKAHAAMGITPTDAALVLAIRAAGPETTGRALSRLHGLSESVVSRIRRGDSHRHLL